MFMVSFSKLNTSISLELCRNSQKVRQNPWCDRVHTMKEIEKGYVAAMLTARGSLHHGKFFSDASKEQTGCLHSPTQSLGCLSLIYYCSWVNICIFKANSFVADA